MARDALRIQHRGDSAVYNVEDDYAEGVYGNRLGEEGFPRGIPVVDPFIPHQEEVDVLF